MIATVASGTTQYLLSDRLSVRLSLDSNASAVGRQGHLPFGEDFGESGTQEKHHFTNYEKDPESGLHYAINRFHADIVGRFRTVDPILDKGFQAIRRTGCSAKTILELLGQPQEIQRYSYVENDPVNAIDPMGTGKWKCIWKSVVCLAAIVAYIDAIGGLASVCGETVGIGCVLAILAHPIMAGIMVEACKDALEACGVEDPREPKPPTDGFFDGDVGNGNGWMGDWGIGSSCNSFNWVANAECHGYTHIDPLESTIEAAGISG